MGFLLTAVIPPSIEKGAARKIPDSPFFNLAERLQFGVASSFYIGQDRVNVLVILKELILFFGNDVHTNGGFYHGFRAYHYVPKIGPHLPVVGSKTGVVIPAVNPIRTIGPQRFPVGEPEAFFAKLALIFHAGEELKEFPGFLGVSGGFGDRMEMGLTGGKGPAIAGNGGYAHGEAQGRKLL
jgi:hypothetical protein